MAATVPAFFTDDAQAQLDDLLMLVCEELQLAPSRYRLAVERYGAVSRVLEGEGSPFHGIPLSIYPQGSMALGTTVHPLDGPMISTLSSSWEFRITASIRWPSWARSTVS